MSRTVNIPRDVVDDYYRYKMPVLRAKVEGKGNGIKTVIDNMEDIAKALSRPPSYPTKFFGFELGALTKVDTENSKYVVNGKHDPESLARVLDDFIRRYVLCFKCNNPETVLEVHGQTITSKCKACGKLNQIDMGHKLSTFILRNPPERPEVETNQRDTGARAVRGAQKKAKQQAEVETDDGVEWSVDTSAKAVEERRRELLGNRDRLTQREDEEEEGAEDGSSRTPALVFPPGENPIPTIRAYFQSDPDPAVCVREVQEAANKMRWSDTQMMKAVFTGLFDGEMKANFYKKCDILALFVKNTKHEKVVLFCIEKLIKDTGLMKDLPHILHGFYEEAIVSEDTIHKWYEHMCKTADAKSGVDPKDKKVALALKENSAPFIEWLKNAESEDESDDF